jgi:adenylate kinase family enzyme
MDAGGLVSDDIIIGMVKARLTELGGEPLVGTPEAFGAMIAAETEKWAKVVNYAGIKVE